MIEVHEYQPDYFNLITMLHESQSSQLSTVLEPTSLPAIGFMAYDSATIIAAGFLRNVEGGYAMIDTLVSNGDLPSQTRHEGLSMLVNKLIETAKCMKLKGIISLTSDIGIISRAQALGFKEINQKVISLSLTEEP